MHSISGNIVDVTSRKVYPAELVVENGKITEIRPNSNHYETFICPGLVDAHVHIESSMLTPQKFGQLVIEHGTVAVVTDPHEIANVMGVKGVRFMIDSSKASPIKTFFSIPSCVPATPFDVSGGIISANDVWEMANSTDFVALSEVMNVPGVLMKDKEVISKLDAAKKNNLPIDGHAPALSGENLKQYVASGISTDHECSNLKEAYTKIDLGMKILIREGSAARNYGALKSLIRSNPTDVMFCTDDSHPDEIIELGHIDKIVKRAIADGFDLFDVLQIASSNPIKHYNLNVGELNVGDDADFMVVDSLTTLNINEVYVKGVKQYDNKILEDKNNQTLSSEEGAEEINNFNHRSIHASELSKNISQRTNVISLTDGELLTEIYRYTTNPCTNLESDLPNDIVKIVYINRYTDGEPQVAYCKGFGIQRGAFASTVSHDSHNIIAVGCTDAELTEAINAVIKQKGGLSVNDGRSTSILPLPIGGIMSHETGEVVAATYKGLNDQIKAMGCTLRSPFMTLAFMSLIVIPEIKIGEKGLFSYANFDWIT